MKPGVDSEVFIAIEVGENVGTFCIVDNLTFNAVKQRIPKAIKN